MLSVNADAKTVKGLKRGYLTGILYLAPADEAGFGNLCQYASAGCRADCLFTAGRGAFANVYQARMEKTRKLFEERDAFVMALAVDVIKLAARAAREGLTPAVRLNGTSDIDWTDFIGQFPGLQFYDYTKDPERMRAFLEHRLPFNYHLTYSLSESPFSRKTAGDILSRGGNVAAVFERLPEVYLGAPVVNGDESDLRFLDPTGVIVGLTAKGKARKDTSGFVIRDVA